MFKSATFKLTMWYLAIVMVISLGFSVVIYHFGTGEVSRGLQHQTQRIFDRYPVFGQDPALRPFNADIDQASHHLLLQLVYFNVLVLIGAGLASYFLARRTLQPIETAHHRQTRFTADVSHELRTPLTSLKMTSEVALLDQHAAKPELRSALESNLEDATKMEILINNLLRLTRLDDADARSVMTETALDDIVQAAARQIAPAAQAKHVRLVAEPASGEIQADADALTQLLVILLDNAIKYSPADSQVALSAGLVDHDVQFTITDQGSGIAADDLPHIFDRFYRADTARTHSSTEGYGLGLSIAKMIVERHNGSITLRSKPGQGTTAIVTLPQRQQTRPDDLSQQPRPTNRHQR